MFLRCPAAGMSSHDDDLENQSEPLINKCRDAAMHDVDEIVSSSDDDSDVDRLQCDWPCATVLHAKSVIDDGFLQVMTRYIQKKGNAMWQRSSSNDPHVISEIEGDADSADDDDKAHLRRCAIASETKTLNRLYGMIDGAVEDVVEVFMEKYPFFSVVTTREDYSLLKFTNGDFFREHIEVGSLDDDCDGAARRLCVIVFLSDAPTEGGRLLFPYQDVDIKAGKGDIVVFPACPLHPNEITEITGNGTLVYAVNYLL